MSSISHYTSQYCVPSSNFFFAFHMFVYVHLTEREWHVVSAGLSGQGPSSGGAEQTGPQSQGRLGAVYEDSGTDRFAGTFCHSPTFKPSHSVSRGMWYHVITSININCDILFRNRAYQRTLMTVVWRKRDLWKQFRYVFLFSHPLSPLDSSFGS